MKIFIGLFFLIISSYAFADLSGDWQGWGNWGYGEYDAPCEMNISFAETKNSFSRKSGYFDCTVVGLDLTPATFLRKGDDLYDGEKLVGKITSNTLELKEAYSDTVTINTFIKVEGRHFDYLEIWSDQNGDEIYKITGRMFLKTSF